MVTVPAPDAKSRFGQILERVAEGEEVIITRQGKPVARIVPEGAALNDTVRAAVAGLRDLRRRIEVRSKGLRLTKQEARAAIDEGRL